jgi:hypothetical protein
LLSRLVVWQLIPRIWITTTTHMVQNESPKLLKPNWNHHQGEIQPTPQVVTHSGWCWLN